jgi:hypothetical protein
MKKLLLALSFLACCAIACKNTTSNETPDIPENIESTKAGKILEDSLKKVYREQLYFAAAGTNVDSIRHENWMRNYALKQSKRAGVSSRSVTETFAGGLIEATWHERGPINEAGDMRVVDFDPATEAIYGVSTVGHLWKGNLNGTTWSLLNDDINFEPDEIDILPHNGGNRIFAIYGSGIDDKIVRFSDDEGQSWTKGTGFSFYDHWGKGRRLITLSDNNTLYYLVHTWSGNPWGQLIQLYKSTNKGVSYTKIWDTPVGYNGEDVDLWKPYGSDNMYLVDNRAQKFYTLDHNFSSGATTISAPASYTNQNIAIGGIHVSGRFNTTVNDYELFMIHDSDQKVYKTTNGANWTFLSTASENVWVKGWLADPDNSNLYVGGFQLNKTSNGVTWQEQYPQWWRYYSHSKDSMHVDIMNLDYFKKSDGTPFIIILNHAGIHITYDRFKTTSNLALQNLNVVTLYDQTTASDGFLYCGAQDKGNFKYSGNSLTNFDLIATDNMSTADGMLGSFFNSDQSFYAMIQNGNLYCFPNREVRSSSSFDIPGTHKPGWINPMVATPNFADNKVYVAGGNLNGGTGSYLITANVSISGTNVTWQNTQFNYDFRANSNNGTSVIKAIGVAMSDHNRIYVATQDAAFFSSTNQGSNWKKITTAGLPSSMIPWDIKCSTTDADKVFVCGTGFSNTGVYQSNNGGTSFTPLNGSIPAATFYEVALSTDESLLFAATSEGPYVYVFGTSTWHSLIGAETPILDFNTVDNVGNNIIRFGTYGRGVWDFAIASAPLPAELMAFTARAMESTNKTKLNWTTASEYNVKEFVVEHSTNGLDYYPIETIPAKGTSSVQQTYQFIHNTPKPGKNYYRLLIRDTDGRTENSTIQVVNFEAIVPSFVVFPNVVQPNEQIHIQPQSQDPYTTALYNLQGQLMLHQQANGTSDVTLNLPKGIYVYRIFSGQMQSTGRIVVQ